LAKHDEKHEMKVKLGFKTIEYNVEGVSYVGAEEVLCNIEGDLSAFRKWRKYGYTIKKFLPEGVYLQFHQGMEDLFKKCIQKAGITVPQGFRMSQYHHLVKNDYDKHLKVIEQTKLLQRIEMPIHMSIIEAKVSEIISIPVESRKPVNGERVFHFRVVRPGEPDFNPIHRDAWQEENKGAINIYVPLAGSNTKSSLLVVPGSHLWPENKVTRTRDGALMNGIKFNVPGVMDSSVPLKLKCPNPGMNQVMVFSPYLLHGGSLNRNRDVTRVSLEMRFWPKKLV